MGMVEDEIPVPEMITQGPCDYWVERSWPVNEFRRRMMALQVEHHLFWVSECPAEGRWAWMKAELLDPVPVVLAHGLSRRFGPQRRHVGVLVGHEGRKHGGGGGVGRLRGVWEMREGTSHVCVASARLDLW